MHKPVINDTTLRDGEQTPGRPGVEQPVTIPESDR